MARRISYLLIAYSYPPVLGGSEIEAQRVCAELRGRGHQAKVLCAGGPPMPPLVDWIDPCGTPVRLLAGNWPVPWRGYVFALEVAWTLIKERREYEIVYFLMQGLHVATGVPVARLLGKRIVMKFSCSGEVTKTISSWLGRLEVRFLRRWASRILILNPEMEREATEAGFDPARIGWMPNPVDTGEFCPCSLEQRAAIRKELNVGADTPLVVFVGRLDHQKKLPWLVAAFERVVREEPRAILMLIGDGPLRAEIGQLVHKLGLENHILFTGRLDGEGVRKWLQAADVFTLISALEGLPCSVLESMSTGLPPVLSDIQAHAQLIDHKVHGLLTELGNEDSIARGILLLLNDPALRARLGAAARRRMLEQYSTPKVADCYENLFASVLGS